AEDRLRVELRDAGLGDAEDLADLAQRELLVVVERDDELLALGQPRDRLAERLLQLGLRQLGLRLGALRVLDRVDQGDLGAAAPGDPPTAGGAGPCVSVLVRIRATWSPPLEEIVHSSSSAAIEERPISERLSSSSSVVRPSFSAISSSVRRRCSGASW